MFILCGALLLVLYMWLTFSFRQFANIAEKIDKRTRPERSARRQTSSYGQPFLQGKGI